MCVSIQKHMPDGFLVIPAVIWLPLSKSNNSLKVVRWWHWNFEIPSSFIRWNISTRSNITSTTWLLGVDCTERKQNRRMISLFICWFVMILVSWTQGWSVVHYFHGTIRNSGTVTYPMPFSLLQLLSSLFKSSHLWLLGASLTYYWCSDIVKAAFDIRGSSCAFPATGL